MMQFHLFVNHCYYIIFAKTNLYAAVFSLNFSSAGTGRFMAGKAQDMCQRRTFLGGRGDSRVRDMARPLMRNFGATFSETSFPIF